MCCTQALSLLRLCGRQVGVFAPCRSSRVSVTLTVTVPCEYMSSAGTQDAVFSAKLKRVPSPLRDALVSAGLADPGLLAAYPRTDAALLGLVCSGDVPAGRRHRLRGKTPGYGAAVRLVYVYGMSLVFLLISFPSSSLILPFASLALSTVFSRTLLGRRHVLSKGSRRIRNRGHPRQ